MKYNNASSNERNKAESRRATDQLRAVQETTVSAGGVSGTRATYDAIRDRGVKQLAPSQAKK